MFYNITEVSQLINLSKETLYEKLKLKELQGHVVKKQGITYIDEVGFKFIKDTFTDFTKEQSKEDTTDKQTSQEISVEEDILNLNKDLFNTIIEQLKQKDLQLKEKDMQLKEKDMQLKEKDLQLHEFNEMLKQELELNKNNQSLLKDKCQDVKQLEEHFTELDTELLDIGKQVNVKKPKESIIKMLNITSDEQNELKIVNKDEKHRWNNENRKAERKNIEGLMNIEGLTRSEKKKLDNITTVKELRVKGLSYTAIAEQLNISRRIVIKYAK